MKKTFVFIMAVSAIFAACSSDEFDGGTQGMTLSAIVEQPASRATMTANEEGNYQFSFTDNDKISVGNTPSTSGYYNFTKSGETFSCATAKPTDSDVDWYAYFPSTPVSLDKQNGELAGVANKYACAGKTAQATTGANGLAITLKPKVAILRIVKVDGNNTKCDINVKTGEKWVSALKATNGAADFDVQTSDTKVTMLTATEPGTYYIAVPAGVKIAIYNGGDKLKATKDGGLTAGKYYTVTTGAVTGEADATINGDPKKVKWVQLWAGGPKFATENVDGTMSWTEANTNEFWGKNWRTPSRDEMTNMVGGGEGIYTFTNQNVKVEYLQENNEFGFKFTGVQPGYTNNSIFLPTVGDKHDKDDGNGNYWTSYQDESTKYCSALSLIYNGTGLYSFNFNFAHEAKEKYALRLVLR